MTLGFPRFPAARSTTQLLSLPNNTEPSLALRTQGLLVDTVAIDERLFELWEFNSVLIQKPTLKPRTARFA
jgi:hypothetical protein